MYKLILSVIMTLISFPSIADTSLCASSTSSTHRVLKTCRADKIEIDTQNQRWQKVDFCLSREERSGGPFGGETIPWYFTNIRLTSAQGEELIIKLENPDGRHNFRSPIDYSVLDLTEGLFLLDSHRTKYPNDNRRGYIDQHLVLFNFSTNRLELTQNQRNPVQFGKWKELFSLAAECL